MSSLVMVMHIFSSDTVLLQMSCKFSSSAFDGRHGVFARRTLLMNMQSCGFICAE